MRINLNLFLCRQYADPDRCPLQSALVRRSDRGGKGGREGRKEGKHVPVRLADDEAGVLGDALHQQGLLLGLFCI